jgi:hypothetical protein
MSINAKLQTLLERAAPKAPQADPMQKLDDKHPGGPGGEDLGGPNDGVAASNAESKASFPGNSGGDATPPKQGDSESPDPAKEEEKLDDTKPGVSASDNASKANLKGNEGGEGAPHPQGSSNLPTPGQPSSYATVIDGIKYTAEEAEAFKATLIEAGIPAEAQDKILEMFEAAVVTRVTAEVDKAGDKLVEAVEALAEENSKKLYEDVNSYLSYIAEKWMEENALAVEQGLRVEIAEDFINGLKNLFNESYIEVPEGKEDLLASTEAKVAELEGKVNESVEQVVRLTETNRALERRLIVESATRDMAATEADKFTKLVEDVEFESTEQFTESVKSLKERYYPKTPGKTVDPSDTANEGEDTVEISPAMSRYVSAISSSGISK